MNASAFGVLCLIALGLFLNAGRLHTLMFWLPFVVGALAVLCVFLANIFIGRWLSTLEHTAEQFVPLASPPTLPPPTDFEGIPVLEEVGVDIPTDRCEKCSTVMPCDEICEWCDCCHACCQADKDPCTACTECNKLGAKSDLCSVCALCDTCCTCIECEGCDQSFDGNASDWCSSCARCADCCVCDQDDGDQDDDEEDNIVAELPEAPPIPAPLLSTPECTSTPPSYILEYPYLPTHPPIQLVPSAPKPPPSRVILPSVALDIQIDGETHKVPVEVVVELGEPVLQPLDQQKVPPPTTNS